MIKYRQADLKEGMKLLKDMHSQKRRLTNLKFHTTLVSYKQVFRHIESILQLEAKYVGFQS